MLVEIEIPQGESEFTVQAALYLLEALVSIKREIMRRDAPPALYDTPGPLYRQEPPGKERFDNITKFSERGWADCDDLAAARVAELREGGELGAKCQVVWPKGQRRYHARVLRENGTTEDPCIVLLKRERNRK